MSDARPIGLMDSGVGGLTVLKETAALLPNEDILYLGDSANMPYGEKTNEAIIQFANQDIAFLESKGVKAIVLACNTVSSLVDHVTARVPLVSIVDAGCAAVLESCNKGKVGLIATTATVRNRTYEKKMAALTSDVQFISHGTKHLAQAINDNIEEKKALVKYIVNAIDPILRQHGISKILLGCTHYPIVKETMESLYPMVHIINPAEMQVKDLIRSLNGAEGLNPQKTKGNIKLYFTGDASNRQSFVDIANILELPYNELKHVTLDAFEKEE